MRAESGRMGTTLLAVAAGSALLAWLLAIFGLDARIDAGGHVAVPPVQAPVLPGHGPDAAALSDTSEIAARPLFSPTRQPAMFRLEALGAPVADAAGLRLTGVLLGPERGLATLQTGDGGSLRLHLGGETVAGWRLLELQPRAALVEGPGGVHSLRLDVVAPEAAEASAAAPPPAIPAAGTADGSTAPAAAGPVSTAPPSTDRQNLDQIRQQIQARRQQLMQARGTPVPPGRDTE